MNDFDDSPHDDEELLDDQPSKSALKREMLALQDLAMQLTTMNDEQLARVPMTPELERAVKETRNIRKREALRRHRQYLGRLMRSADHEAISASVSHMSEQHNRLTRMLHVMESWRDELISGDDTVVARFVDEFPNVDRQLLRQLVRNAKSEAAANKPPASARKLFKLIRAEMVREDEVPPA